MPPRNQDQGLSTWYLPIIVVLVLIILILIYPSILQLVPTLTNPNVNVTGMVIAHGFTARPDHVTFVGAGSPSTVAVSSQGTYSITLQNGHIYNITVGWSAAGGLVAGNCSAGSLNLRSSKPTVTYNISC